MADAVLRKAVFERHTTVTKERLQVSRYGGRARPIGILAHPLLRDGNESPERTNVKPRSNRQRLVVPQPR